MAPMDVSANDAIKELVLFHKSRHWRKRGLSEADVFADFASHEDQCNYSERRNNTY
jgi:hypothetical protein